MDDKHEILTSAQAAALLQINANVLRVRSQRGLVPGAFKVGKLWRYRRDELIGLGEKPQKSETEEK